MQSGFKISVIIPTYNRAKKLERCLVSILSQTYLPYEIIVVDDGSTDETMQIIEAINSPIIKVLKQIHQGAQKARNLGVYSAKGEYIAFMDSDDEWISNKLELQVAILQEHPNWVLYTNCYIKDEDSGDMRIWNVSGKSGSAYRSMLETGGPMFQGLILKKESLLAIGGLDEKVDAYQEWDTAIALAKHYELLHMREPLFVYYQHSGETISKNKKKEINGYEYIIRKNKKDIKKICGKKVLNRNYQILLNKSVVYNDKRYVKFFLQYILTL